jgi:glucose-6-phosphate isomerase
MTKGHFHAERDGDEVYLGVSGQGWILLQEEQGIPARLELGAGELAYIPAGWAHRTINTGKDALVFISLYSVDAGHDYQRIIERGGFPQLAVATPDGAALLDNPAFHITE